MGLLDDAIREHLDLKRRRGGDPTEIARLEQEALGPVRREPEPPAPQEAPEAVNHGAVVTEPAREVHEHEHDDVTPAQEERLFEAPEPEDAPAAEAPAAEADPEPEPASAPQDHLLQPTTEYHVEDDEDFFEDEADTPAEPAAHDEPGEDVLEETPDFLQETPEHDRLWFEQRPPRDFDFDG